MPIVQYDSSNDSSPSNGVNAGHVQQSPTYRSSIPNVPSNLTPGVKLFVGQLPPDIDDEILRQHFIPYGTVLESVILRDKFTQQSKKCGFVTMATVEEAQQACLHLNDRFQFNGAKRPVIVRRAGERSPMDVKFRDLMTGQHPQSAINPSCMLFYLVSNECVETLSSSECMCGCLHKSLLKFCLFFAFNILNFNFLAAMSSFPPNLHGAIGEVKLYVGMLSRNSTEAEVRDLFQQFGPVTEVYILKDKITGQNKGNGFVKYAQRNQALAAIAALNEKYRDKAAPGLLNFVCDRVCL